MFFVYVLQSQKDGDFYIGQTMDINSRLKAHQAGKVKSTKSRRPLILVYWEQVETRMEALIKEKEWKSASGRRRLKRIIGDLVDKKIKD